MNINYNKILYIDIETMTENDLPDWKYYKNKFNQKQFPIQISFISHNKTLCENYFIQSIYRVDREKCFLESLYDHWNENKKVSLIVPIERLIELSKEDYVFCGWNILGFDIPILRRFSNWEFNPNISNILDLYLALSMFYKGSKEEVPMLNGKRSLKADVVFKFLSETDLDEKHFAESDVLLERFNLKELTHRHGIEWLNNYNVRFPNKAIMEVL